MDTMMNHLSNAGIGVVPVLACGYERMLPDGLNPSDDPSLCLRRVAVHSKVLVRHYKDIVKFWQIENEPNWWPMHEAAAWRRGAVWLEGEGFRDKLLELLNTVVHEEDSQARTVINLEADAGRLEPGEYAKHCGILGLDFYPNCKRADPIDVAILRRAEEFHEAVGKPVFIAETGYPSDPGLLGYSQEKQAQYVEAVCREAFSMEKVNAIGIWRYIDGPWRSFPEQENHFGLIDGKGGFKEAWRAYGEIVRSLKS